MVNVIIIGILILICLKIIHYLVSEKKKGHCVGCSKCNERGACGYYAGKQQKEYKENRSI